MTTPPLSSVRPSKLAVWVAAVCIGIGWLLIAIFIFVFILVSGGVVSGRLPMQISLSPLTMRVFLTCVGIFLLAGFGWVSIALSLRCPHCGFKFLKNPKGMGPAEFVYHADCPTRAGINPWAIQIGRFLTSGKIRCIGCGREVFSG